MKKVYIIGSIAIAIIAGVSIFAACTKEENKESKHCKEVSSSINNKNLSEDELNELMQNYDAKFTVLDEECYVTTYYYAKADFCVKSYTDVDNTTFSGICFYDEEATYTFTQINDNKVQIGYDDFTDSVFLTNILFNEDEHKISFDLKVGELELSGTSIEVSETLLAEFMGFATGASTSLSAGIGEIVGRIAVLVIKELVSDAIGSIAKECIRSMERSSRDCLRAGGFPRVEHRLGHLWCSFECREKRPY